MAALKDTLIQGSARVTDTLYANNLTSTTINGLTLTAATTGFTIAGGTTSKTLTVNNTYTLGAACAKGVTDNSSATAVTSSDTNLITGRTLYYAGYVKTDTHVNVTATAAAITKNYILMTSTAPTSTATQHTALGSSSMWINAADKGKFELVLGNATATSSSGGQYGQLALYSASTAGTYLKAADGTSWKTATLQAKDGTIALTSDIPTNLNQLTNGPGYITASSNITGTAANVTGTVAVANGGTGATSASNARTNLGLGSIAVKADTDYVKYAGNVTSLGSSSPHGTVKTWWESTTNVPKLSIIAAYNNSGTEYSFLFSKGNADKTYGSVLRWGYNDRYMYLLRKKAADTWLSSDWEKIYAGYADSAGLATTAEDTTSTLYPIGVTSAATTTLKRDTSITMVGNAITATTYKVTTNATITYNSTSGCLEITV